MRVLPTNPTTQKSCHFRKQKAGGCEIDGMLYGLWQIGVSLYWRIMIYGQWLVIEDTWTISNSCVVEGELFCYLVPSEYKVISSMIGQCFVGLSCSFH